MRNLFKIAALAALTVACVSAGRAQIAPNSGKKADKPLFRDPVYDGAADPIVRWNHAEKRWFMFYTNRRANIETTNGVDWVHGTPIGIAESTDGGATWTYRGQAKINNSRRDSTFLNDMVFIIDYGKPDITFWAPDIVYHNKLYHMYLTVVPGTFDTWSYPRNIVHLTSSDMLEWNPVGIIRLANNKVIDAGVARMPDGKWIMYYNNEKDGKSIYYAESDDLYTWNDKGRLQGDFPPGEGPTVFAWKDKYFMVVDNWKGFGVYSSDDMINWTRQPNRILETPGTGPDDGVMGNHADVVVSGGKAYIFYFTHPGRKKSDGGGAAGNGGNGYEFRRSSIQVAELKYENGEITCDRDKPVYINLKPN